MDGFAIEIKEDEVWDDVAAFVPIEDPREVEEFVRYQIPAGIVNPRGTARRVPLEERRRLFLYGVDWEDLERIDHHDARALEPGAPGKGCIRPRGPISRNGMRVGWPSTSRPSTRGGAGGHAGRVVAANEVEGR